MFFASHNTIVASLMINLELSRTVLILSTELNTAPLCLILQLATSLIFPVEVQKRTFELSKGHLFAVDCSACDVFLSFSGTKSSSSLSDEIASSSSLLEGFDLDLLSPIATNLLECIREASSLIFEIPTVLPILFLFGLRFTSSSSSVQASLMSEASVSSVTSVISPSVSNISLSAILHDVYKIKSTENSICGECFVLKVVKV